MKAEMNRWKKIMLKRVLPPQIKLTQMRIIDFLFDVPLWFLYRLINTLIFQFNAIFCVCHHSFLSFLILDIIFKEAVNNLNFEKKEKTHKSNEN